MNHRILVALCKWQGTFKISKDPEFAEKVAEIVGLYLAPPRGAVVLSVDEKTQVQALDLAGCPPARG